MKKLRRLGLSGAMVFALVSTGAFVADAANEPATAKPIVIYNNPNFLAQIKGSIYTSYFDGEVTSETAKQLTQDEQGGHSPWRDSPLLVSVYGTQNFTPDSNGPMNQTSLTSKEFVGTYRGHEVTYTLVSSSTQTAAVVEKGLSFGMTIDLYKPLHHYYWMIDQVQINN